MGAVPAATQFPNAYPYGGSIASVTGADVFNRSIYDPVSTWLIEPFDGANQEGGPPTYDSESDDVKYPASHWIKALPNGVKQEGTYHTESDDIKCPASEGFNAFRDGANQEAEPLTYDTKSDEDKSIDRYPASDRIEGPREHFDLEVFIRRVSDLRQQVSVTRKLFEALANLKEESLTYNTKSGDVEIINEPPLSEGFNACVDGVAKSGGDSNKDDAETKEGDLHELFINEDLRLPDNVPESSSNKENTPPGSEMYSQLHRSGPAHEDDDESYHGDTEWSSKSTRRRVRSVTARQPRPFQRQVIGRSRVQHPMREGKHLLSARALRQLEQHVRAS